MVHLMTAAPTELAQARARIAELEHKEFIEDLRKRGLRLFMGKYIVSAPKYIEVGPLHPMSMPAALAGEKREGGE